VVSDAVFERYKEALKQGHVAMLRGVPKGALEHYGEAARLADHRALPHLSKGSVLLQLGRAQDALASFDRAVERSPDEATAHTGRASALAALGRATEARAAVHEAERLDAQRERARALAEEQARAAARRQGPDALVDESEALARAGDSPGAAVLLVAAAGGYVARGALDAALDACHRGVAVAPDPVDVHLAMVRCHVERGWHERAVERLLLLGRFIELGTDAGARATFEAGCLEQQGLDPRLEVMAHSADAAALEVDASENTEVSA